MGYGLGSEPRLGNPDSAPAGGAAWLRPGAISILNFSGKNKNKNNFLLFETAPRGSQRRTKPGSALPGGGGPRGWGRGQNGKAQKTNGTAPHPRSARPGPALRGGDSSERAVPRSLSAPRERPRPAGGERGRYGGGGRAGPRAGSRSGAVGPDRRGALPAALVPPRGGAWRAAARARRQPCRDPAGSGAVGALGRGCAPRRAVLRAAVTRLCAALRGKGRRRRAGQPSSVFSIARVGT